MDDFLLQEYYFKLKLIGIYQIIGGVIGLGIMIWLFTMVLPVSFMVATILIISLLSFLFSIACGLGLVFKKSWAKDLSLVLQLVQIINFSLFGYSFKFISGLGILLNFDFTHSTQVKLEASEPWFSFTNLSDPNEMIISVNLAAILMAFFILDLKRKIVRLLENSDLTIIETSSGYQQEM